MPESTIDWNIPEQRLLYKELMMTACDLSSMSKPFNINRNITDGLYGKFMNIQLLDYMKKLKL